MRALCAEQLDDMENRLARSISHDAERQDVEAALGGLRAQIAAHQASAESLRREEQALLQMISTEQVRWRDVNSRLDELERGLPARSS
jgi:chromosome segregation ATPase